MMFVLSQCLIGLVYFVCSVIGGAVNLLMSVKALRTRIFLLRYPLEFNLVLVGVATCFFLIPSYIINYIAQSSTNLTGGYIWCLMNIVLEHCLHNIVLVTVVFIALSQARYSFLDSKFSIRTLIGLVAATWSVSTIPVIVVLLSFLTKASLDFDEICIPDANNMFMKYAFVSLVVFTLILISVLVICSSHMRFFLRRKIKSITVIPTDCRSSVISKTETNFNCCQNDYKKNGMTDIEDFDVEKRESKTLYNELRNEDNKSFTYTSYTSCYKKYSGENTTQDAELCGHGNLDEDNNYNNYVQRNEVYNDTKIKQEPYSRKNEAKYTSLFDSRIGKDKKRFSSCFYDRVCPSLSQQIVSHNDKKYLETDMADIVRKRRIMSDSFTDSKFSNFGDFRDYTHSDSQFEEYSMSDYTSQSTSSDHKSRYTVDDFNDNHTTDNSNYSVTETSIVSSAFNANATQSIGDDSIASPKNPRPGRFFTRPLFLKRNNSNDSSDLGYPNEYGTNLTKNKRAHILQKTFSTTSLSPISKIQFWDQRNNHDSNPLPELNTVLDFNKDEHREDDHKKMSMQTNSYSTVPIEIRIIRPSELGKRIVQRRNAIVPDYDTCYSYTDEAGGRETRSDNITSTSGIFTVEEKFREYKKQIRMKTKQRYQVSGVIHTTRKMIYVVIMNLVTLVPLFILLCIYFNNSDNSLKNIIVVLQSFRFLCLVISVYLFTFGNKNIRKILCKKTFQTKFSIMFF